MIPLLLLVACNAPPPMLPGSAVAEVQPTAVLHATGRLVGFNLGAGTRYAAEDDPFHPEWRSSERRRAIESLSLFRNVGDEPPTMRFSGLLTDGAEGEDGYHFEDFVRENRGASPSDDMAPFEYMTLIDEAGAKPIVTLNFGSGSAAEAGAYAAHLEGTDGNDENVQMRALWGDVDPYGIRTFDVGNSPYASWNTGYSASGGHSYSNPGAAQGGDSDWHGRPSSAAADYAARALAYIEAVLVEAPESRFRVPLSHADMQGWGGPSDAVLELAPVLEHPAVEAVVIAHYQVDAAAALGFADGNDPAVVLGGTALVEPGYQAMFDAVAAVDRDEPLRVEIGEFGVGGYQSDDDFDLGRSAALGLGTADMLIAFANWGVDAAAQQVSLGWDSVAEDPIAREWYQPHRYDENGVQWTLPRTRVYKLFADLLLDDTVAIDITGQTEFVGGDGSDTAPLFSYKPLVGTAFVSADGDAMTLFVLNRDPIDAHPLRLALPEQAGWLVADAEAWDPWLWDWGVYSGAGPNYDPDVRLSTFPWRQSNDVVDLDIPRASVVAVRLER